MNGYGEVFRELTSSPANLQEPVLFGERRQDIRLEVVNGPAFIAAQPKAGTLEAVEGKIDVQQERWPSVRLANIAYGNERVLILVNSAAAHVQVRLGGIPADSHLATISGGDAARLEKTSASTDVTLEPFAALVLRVSRM
jgi:hypothetical protein